MHWFSSLPLYHCAPIAALDISHRTFSIGIGSVLCTFKSCRCTKWLLSTKLIVTQCELNRPFISHVALAIIQKPPCELNPVKVSNDWISQPLFRGIYTPQGRRDLQLCRLWVTPVQVRINRNVKIYSLGSFVHGLEEFVIYSQFCLSC